MFQLENVNKIYKNKETEFKALDNISLEIAEIGRASCRERV